MYEFFVWNCVDICGNKQKYLKATLNHAFINQQKRSLTYIMRCRFLKLSCNAKVTGDSKCSSVDLCC